jgi:hypothetical protein
MKNLFKNWKTTVTGLAILIVAVLKTVGVDLPYPEITALLSALGLALSKDSTNDDNNPS